ncbi:hypothetical protein LguiB_003534 [Lonicera macranthoides]
MGWVTLRMDQWLIDQGLQLMIHTCNRKAKAYTLRYVKLTKDQAPLEEDIRPGELNQPINVPQSNVCKCNECGQPLPESFEPLANEPWTTGIFCCAEDTESCWTGLCYPCVLFGHNVERLRDDTSWTSAYICHAIFIEGDIALAAATVAFLEHREMKGRLSDDAVIMPITIVNPPSSPSRDELC